MPKFKLGYEVEKSHNILRTPRQSQISISSISRQSHDCHRFCMHSKNYLLTLREKCPCPEFFWSVFYCIWTTEYGEIQSISTYTVRMRENTDRKNFEYGFASYIKLLKSSANLTNLFQRNLWKLTNGCFYFMTTSNV